MAMVLPIVEPSSKRRKIQSDVHTLPHVQALHNAEVILAFKVLSDTIMPASLGHGGAVTLGDFGFHTPRPLADGARMLQISWATSGSDVKEHLVERPGAVADGYGRPLPDVLLEFYDVLLSMPRNFRLVTYHIEGAASLVSQEMLRCGLHFVRQNFEHIVRTQGHCLMDPAIHGCMHDGPPSFPTLEELAAALPDEERALPSFLPGGDECLLYLRLARGLREATLPECRRIGHMPVRSMMRLSMRDNGFSAQAPAYPKCSLREVIPTPCFNSEGYRAYGLFREHLPGALTTNVRGAASLSDALHRG